MIAGSSPVNPASQIRKLEEPLSIRLRVAFFLPCRPRSPHFFHSSPRVSILKAGRVTFNIYVLPLSDILVEVIESLNLTQAELAERIGRALKTIKGIIVRNTAVTPETALQF